MKTLVAVLGAMTLAAGIAHAEMMERCSYKTERPDGSVRSAVEEPGLADGSNAKRFERIRSYEESGKDGWKGYRTFDVICVPLDNEKTEYHLFVQTYNGQVSLSHGLTENACWYTLHSLRNSRRDGPVPPSYFERGECFK